MKDKEIKKLSKAFIKKYVPKELSYDILSDAAEREGYTVVEFNPLINDEDVETLIDALNVRKLLNMSRAFTCSKNNCRVIFIDDRLSDNEKLLVLAHEIGHICCGHMEKAYVIGQDIVEEYEANRFANCLLDIKKGFSVKINKKLIAASLTGCGVLVSGLVVTYGYYHYNQYMVEENNKIEYASSDKVHNNYVFSKTDIGDFQQVDASQDFEVTQNAIIEDTSGNEDITECETDTVTNTLETTDDNTTTEEKTTEETITEETITEETITEETITEETITEETTTIVINTEDIATNWISTIGSTTKETTAKETTAKETTVKNTSIKETTTQIETAPKTEYTTVSIENTTSEAEPEEETLSADNVEPSHLFTEDINPVNSEEDTTGQIITTVALTTTATPTTAMPTTTAKPTTTAEETTTEAVKERIVGGSPLTGWEYYDGVLTFDADANMVLWGSHSDNFIDDIGDWDSSNFVEDVDKSLVKEIVLNDVTYEIPDGCFKGYCNLEKITIPDTVCMIGKSAFEGCSSLEEIVIPDSVEIIYEKTFAGCTSLKKVILGENVKGICTEAFLECTSLTELYIPKATYSFADNSFKYSGLRTLYVYEGYANVDNLRLVRCSATIIKYN